MSIPDPIVLLDARAKYIHPAFQISRASTKTAFDSSGRLVTVPANALAWGRNGLLREGAAVNSARWSNDLSQGAWTKLSSTTIVPSAIIGPDGNGMAKVVEGAASGNQGVQQNISITPGSPTCFQIVASAAERSLVRLLIYGAGDASNSARADISLSDGSVMSVGSSGAATDVFAGTERLYGGVWRIWISAVLGAETAAQHRMQMFSPNNDLQYPGDGTSGVYAGYAQQEQGVRPSSYIETGNASASRVRDSLILPALADHRWWRPDRGTFLFDLQLHTHNYMDVAASWTDQGSERLEVRSPASGGPQIVQLIGPFQWITVIPAGRFFVRNILAVTWEGSTVTVTRNGEVPVTRETNNQSPVMPDNPDFGLGNRPGGANNFFCNATYRRLAYYPDRLSNADLQSLTAMQE